MIQKLIRLPRRIQLRRTKGWRKPEGAIVVTRSTKWGNPFRVDTLGRRKAVAMYRLWLTNKLTDSRIRRVLGDLDEYDLATKDPLGWLTFLAAGNNLARQLGDLRGKDLCCWCPLDQPCHADVLLKEANK